LWKHAQQNHPFCFTKIYCYDDVFKNALHHADDSYPKGGKKWNCIMHAPHLWHSFLHGITYMDGLLVKMSFTVEHMYSSAELCGNTLLVQIVTQMAKLTLCH
jgi:hypothetical protein